LVVRALPWKRDVVFVGPPAPAPVGPALVVRALPWEWGVVLVVVSAPVLLKRPARLVAVMGGWPLLVLASKAGLDRAALKCWV
jgi:hypothetical protein